MKLICGHDSPRGNSYRGCCYDCYAKMAGQVNRKQTTWQQLILEGKCTEGAKSKKQAKKGGVS